ncbi:uncharacterized protein FPRO_13418 [Fusarium proliferatum ET1]|uniref:BTB domain-containing protein n=1 Tax=Fusarium proliferatum (strain ET1) TaxID=1227346 RepID=A0A1L7W5X1_FUSPR|nr:uncharacterized protein FPRO_13418 [Fusarium proliferatum ET1]CZR47751.1 uncharacterized protein FPRO_13418 [Fusarium proliferatum ET1]
MSQDSATISPDLPAQFITSPYADSFVKVLLKGKSITWIHRGVVPDNVLSNKSTHELGSKSASPILDMQNIGNDIAHVILHYFYTKQYDCIKPSGTSGDIAKGYELRVSLQVIEAARKTQLFNLVDLAKEQCARLCHQMDLLNLVAILGKINIDYDNFPELTKHIAFHLEKVLANPHSQFSNDLLNRVTSNSITDMLIRKLIMVARDEPTSEPKAKPRPENEARNLSVCPSIDYTSTVECGIAKPEWSPFTYELRTQDLQKLRKNPQPDDKGKGRDVSRSAENPSKVPEIRVSHHELRGAKGQKEAQSGPSRANPPTPKLESTIAYMKDFVAAEKSSAADWQVPKSEAEKSETSESDRESTIAVVSDDEGVLVESSPEPNMTPSPVGSGNTNSMDHFLVYDQW